MLDTVRDKLREIYDRLCERHIAILEQFIEQFGEDFVDSNIYSFDKLVEWFSDKTLGSFTHKYQDSNEYGHYSIDIQDYDINGRGKPFLEYVPDLGLLDYITPIIEAFLGIDNTKYIIVHFPQVRVTNEYDEFIDIQDLYAKVEIRYDGRLRESFKLSRTTYPYKQFKVGYAHSHMYRITANSAGEWSYPCTGTGPINGTMESLEDHYDKQLWGLFTYELAKYVTIESIAGTPYIRLSSVGRGDVNEAMSNFNTQSLSFMDRNIKHLIDAFTKYYSNNCKFKFKFVKGQYQIGDSVVSTIVNLSNEFIKFLNDYKTRIAEVPSLQSLKEQGVFANYIVTNNKIYSISNDQRDISSASRVNGKDLFRFKDTMVKLKILVDNNITENQSLLLTKIYCEAIITNVLSIINYKYGKRQNQSQSQSQRGSDQGSIQASTNTDEKLYII